MAVVERENCCLPGDITITPIYSGFLIGRALPEQGPGPWWEYVKIVRDWHVAVSEARALARATKASVWFHETGEKFTPIPPDATPPAP